MPDNEQEYSIEDMSGGTNRKVSTSPHTKNKFNHTLNATFNTIIGGISKRLGTSQKGSDLTSTTSTSTSTSTTTTSTSTSTSTSTTTSTTTTSTSTTTTSTSTSTTTTA